MSSKPEITSDKFACGHCGNTSYMLIKGGMSDTVTEGDEEYGFQTSGDYYRLLKCPNCDKSNIFTHFWHDSMDEGDEVTESLIFPQSQAFPVGLPTEILASLTSAEKVKHLDVHAYALLLGRTLELVCQDRGAKTNTLYPMLKELADKGDIPGKLVDVASGLRNFRNMGAHAGMGDLKASELPIVRALLDAILTYIYSAQHLSDLAAAKLAKIKKRRKA